MRNTSFFLRWILPVLMVLATGALSACRCEAATGRTGEGIVIACAGKVEARYPLGSGHDGRSKTQDLFVGLSVGERTTITTGQDGHLCMVLTPGALMHVPPDTSVTITQLRHSADGLPTREEDLVRSIAVTVSKGRLYIDGGVPTPSLSIRVETEAGNVQANGGIFSVAEEAKDKRWSIYSKTFDVLVTSEDGETERLDAGQYGNLASDGVNREAVSPDSNLHDFILCEGYFRDMEQSRQPMRGFDRQAIARYMGLSGLPVFLGDDGIIADVSPSLRETPRESSLPSTPASVGGPDGNRWGEERIRAWWGDIGVIRGINYIPRNCVNSTEFWTKGTFDKDVIGEELSWAQDMGYTSVRVLLQQAVWQDDPDGFMDRLDAFVDIAGRHGLKVVPVLFDDMNRAHREPSVGPQPAPIPGVYNSQWTPSPGPSRVTDQSQWPPLEAYTRAVVKHFKRDRRILYWDLYNTAGNDDLWDQSLPLMDQVFNWVRDINPKQPLAAAAWKDFSSPMTARKLERSDIITFQSFETADLVEEKIRLLSRYDRPLILADWLLRQQGSTFEKILPVCSQHSVGWFSHGLVKGKTQTWIQQADLRNEAEPDLWQQDVLQPDGTPYDKKEAELIRGFRYTEGTTW